MILDGGDKARSPSGGAGLPVEDEGRGLAEEAGVEVLALFPDRRASQGT